MRKETKKPVRKLSKTVQIYSKNGNKYEIEEHLKEAFIGKGYFMEDPTKIKSKEEVK